MSRRFGVSLVMAVFGLAVLLVATAVPAVAQSADGSGLTIGVHAGGGTGTVCWQDVPAGELGDDSPKGVLGGGKSAGADRWVPGGGVLAST